MLELFKNKQSDENNTNLVPVDNHLGFWQSIKPNKECRIKTILWKYIDEFEKYTKTDIACLCYVQSKDKDIQHHLVLTTHNDHPYRKTILTIKHRDYSLFPMTIQYLCSEGCDEHSFHLVNDTSSLKEYLDNIFYSDDFKNILISLLTYCKYRYD